MGADVIKVESPIGDQTRDIGPSRTRGMGSYYANLNRNKRSIVLDLKRKPAMDALWRLIEGADVFVHNMRIGAMERLGLGYAAVAARNPRIVYACATGFRQGSTMQESPAYDDLIQGMSGMASLNAGPDGAPRYFPTVAADKITGHVLASMIAMALVHRARTGQGQEVHVPMMETMLNFHAGRAFLVRRRSTRPSAAWVIRGCSRRIAARSRRRTAICASSRCRTRNGARCSPRWASPN